MDKIIQKLLKVMVIIHLCLTGCLRTYGLLLQTGIEQIFDPAFARVQGCRKL